MPENSSRTRQLPRRLPRVVMLGSSIDLDDNEIVGLLGIKGESLHRMSRRGLPVPPGLVVTTATRGKLPAALSREIDAGIAKVETATGLRVGDPVRPLSLVLRCSMPPGTRSPTPAMRDVAAGARNRPEAVAILRRHLNDLYRDRSEPLAVIVQAMVHADCRRGYTRDPETGADRVVLDDGEKPPASIARLKRELEQCFRDMQEFEFAIDAGQVQLLGSRTPSRTTRAAVRVAADLARRRVISPGEALLRIDPAGVERLLHAGLKTDRAATPIATGIAGSPGAAVGRLAFSADDALERARGGERVILVRSETEPSDIPAMKLCAGVLTSSGGMTSHAAVVARGWGICAVVGVAAMHVDPKRRQVIVAGKRYGVNDTFSIDGNSGVVYAGAMTLVPPTLDRDLRELLEHADRFRVLRIRANADTPRDAETARRLGAEGIGLCRTEHMFFEGERLAHMRAMILADTEQSRRAALAKLLPMQRDDFVGLFTAMRGQPVTIRLLDAPLHEFLPTRNAEIRELARSIGMSETRVRRRLSQLREVNPMLGHRGDRLAITCPEVLEMQVRAIIEAACHCRRRGIPVRPEILVPLVGSRGELEFCRRLADVVAVRVMRERKVNVEYRFGTMIEVPRAAMVADELAGVADFFSFGTNDLTQLAFGYSRDDCGSFLPLYLDRGILPEDPFRSLDVRGVGELIRVAIQRGRSTRPDLSCGLCGEHGGDPRSVAFCHDVGVNYVSCSPLRVPIARLAAAQAALRQSLTRR